jgi:glycosyltransferase involved in cell wall biosynthesis
VDAIVSPGSIPVSFLDCSQPIVIWTDATFAGMMGYYPSMNKLSHSSITLGLSTEKEFFRRAAVSVFASTWAADSAIRLCGADPNRVRVVPLGAILPAPPLADAVATAIRARPTDRCQVLFIGREWHRKGGDIAVDAVAAMNRAGVPTELHIAGESPQASLPSFVKPRGFLSKYSPDGALLMDRLLKESHFLMLPSRAEAFGMAPCEANAFGVPAIVARTGGLAEVVRDGRNGFALSPGSCGSDYAKIMLELVRDRTRYETLCQASREEFETRLNWNFAAKRVKTIIEEAIQVRKTAISAHSPLRENI